MNVCPMEARQQVFMTQLKFGYEITDFGETDQ